MSTHLARYANSVAAEVRILVGQFMKMVLRSLRLFVARMVQSVSVFTTKPA